MTESGGPSRSQTTAFDGGDIRAEKARTRWAWTRRAPAHSRLKILAAEIDLFISFTATDLANAIFDHSSLVSAGKVARVNECISSTKKRCRSGVSKIHRRLVSIFINWPGRADPGLSSLGPASRSAVYFFIYLFVSSFENS